ncbi:scyllo-inositol 2-dehydrogenase (NAD(+)) [bacterium HR21]|nr:scyllo-inositol 2-dehydrogenase (NAD(+)) [bacterium HR21]
MIRVAVIGVGHMGQLHAQKWRQHPDVQLVGVYDSDPVRCQDTARTLGVTAFPSLEEALAAADAVTIATPSYTHGALTIQALRAGCHCLVEKPLATSAAEAEQLVHLAQQAGLVLMAGHIERFNPAFLWVRRLGVQPRFVEVHRLHPFRPRSVDVSVVFDVMIHDLDLLVVLLGSALQRLEAHGVPVLTARPDIANVRLVFANGCVANVTASRVSAKFLRKMRLFEPYRYVALDFAERSVEHIQLRLGETALMEGEECMAEWISDSGIRSRIVRSRLLGAESADPLWEEQHAFLRAIQSRALEDVGIEQTLEAVQLAERIEQAILGGL